MTRQDQSTVIIPNHRFLQDHRFLGRAVLPAAEALGLLADMAAKSLHEDDVLFSCDAEFKRFLYLPDSINKLEARIEIQPEGEASVRTTLKTITRGKKTAVTRAKDHVTVCFGVPQSIPSLPMDVACALVGVPFKLSADLLYKELVPFGSSYHNCDGDLYLNPKGVMAKIVAPEHPNLSSSLGSPFVFDAALHAANAWGQRYLGIVAFPTGYEKRFIFKPTLAGQHYLCHAIPGLKDPNELSFDIWIFHVDGQLCEAIVGQKMRDLSAGRMKPPQWIVAESEDDFEALRTICADITVVDNQTLAPFAALALTEAEAIRGKKMKPKRLVQFTAARIALKRLARRHLKLGDTLNARSIETVSFNLDKPGIVINGERKGVYCSASHTDRFTFAAMDNAPIGVDVEKVTDRALQNKRLFMSDAEKRLVMKSSLGHFEASTRIWTIKEAYAKASDIGLATAWKRVEVTRVGKFESVFLIDDRQSIAVHSAVNDHIFTLVKLFKGISGTRH
ncbi:4'-phosphopantetheinyl transferase superfamily protein [Thermodesulfobacteriota bacterium]